MFQNEKKKMLLEHLFLNVGCAVVKDSTGTQIDETGSTQSDTEREYVMVEGRKNYIPNMDYDPESDSYICRNGKQLTVVSKRTQKTATGDQREVTIYECNSCDSCPYKKDCIKGNNCKTAFEERNKKLSVSRNGRKSDSPFFAFGTKAPFYFNFVLL
ncbi:transposase [Agathobacter ruminis]|nr:transposase [Agathobacter ruminis]